MKPIRTVLAIALLCLTLPFLTSCEKEPMDEGTGTFRVSMTDAPANYAGLEVEITKVSVYSDRSGWVELNQDAQYVQVLELTNGAKTDIAFATDVEAGLYTRLKITFGDRNTLSVRTAASLGDGNVYAQSDFAMQYEGEREIILEINEQLSAEGTAGVLIDFDAASSIREDLNGYVLKPVLREIKDSATGLRGQIEGWAYAHAQLQGAGQTINTYANASGAFFFQGMQPGTYDLILTPVFGIMDATQPDSQIIRGVVITEGEIRNMGRINF